MCQRVSGLATLRRSVGRVPTLLRSVAKLDSFWCIVGLFVRSYRRIEMPAKDTRGDAENPPSPDTTIPEPKPVAATTT